MENILGALAGFVIILLILVVAIYVAQAIFLNKFNKLVNGKGTPMAWIPVANIYLLGKLTFNKIVGWVLVVCFFLTGSTTTTINGVETTHTFLPENISSVISSLNGFAIFGLFIYAIIKYNKLKKEKNSTVDPTIQTQPVQQPMMQEPIQPTIQAQPVQQPMMQEPIQPTIQAQPVQQPMMQEPIQPTIQAQPSQNPVDTETTNIASSENIEQNPFKW